MNFTIVVPPHLQSLMNVVSWGSLQESVAVAGMITVATGTQHAFTFDIAQTLTGRAAPPVAPGVFGTTAGSGRSYFRTCPRHPCLAEVIISCNNSNSTDRSQAANRAR